MPTRTASACYDGLGKQGKGSVSVQSGALNDHPYGFATRFEDQPGTNPEELVAAAHASCFTMALSFALAREGYDNGTLETMAYVTLDRQGDGFAVTRSDLELNAHVPGIKAEDFARIAENAKKTCPVSKLLNADITLKHHLKS